MTSFQKRLGKAMADHVATVAKERLPGYTATLSAEELERMGIVLRLQLAL